MSIVKITIILNIILIIFTQKLAEAVVPVIKDQSRGLHRTENSLGINFSLAVHFCGVRIVITRQVCHPASTSSDDQRYQFRWFRLVQFEDDGGASSSPATPLVAGAEVLDLVDPVVAVLVSARRGEIPRHPGVLVIVSPGVALVRQHWLERFVFSREARAEFRNKSPLLPDLSG